MAERRRVVEAEIVDGPPAAAKPARREDNTPESCCSLACCLVLAPFVLLLTVGVLRRLWAFAWGG